MSSATDVRRIAITSAESVETIVTGDCSVIDGILEGFCTRMMRNTNVIGLSTECTYYQRKSILALLQLCDGKQCLIVKLFSLYVVPKSLFNFLNLAEVSFVGIGIKKSVERLEKEYDICCKNAMELYELTLRRKSLLGPSPLPRHQPNSAAILGDWGADCLSDEQIESATYNAYYFYTAGVALLYDCW